MPGTQIIRDELDCLRRLLYRGLAVVIIAVGGVGWGSDYRSCLRQQPIRKTLREEAEVSRRSADFWDARGEHEIAARARERARIAEKVPELGCLQLLPEA